MSLPTSSDIPRIAEGLRNAAAWLEEHGARVLDAHSARTLDESPGPITRVGVSDPTGSAGAALVDEWLGKQQLALRFLLEQLYGNAADTVDLMNRVLHRLEPPKARSGQLSDQSGPSCVERFCEDPASSKCAGRCEPCYRWRRRYSSEHGGELPGNVPESVIAQRVALRENRKVHITGPMAGEVA